MVFSVQQGSKADQIHSPSFVNVWKDLALTLPIKGTRFYLLLNKEGLDDLVEQILGLKADELSL